MIDPAGHLRVLEFGNSTGSRATELPINGFYRAVWECS